MEEQGEGKERAWKKTEKEIFFFFHFTSHRLKNKQKKISHSGFLFFTKPSNIPCAMG